MSTLIEELEQAAGRADARALHWQSLGLECGWRRFLAGLPLNRQQKAHATEAARLRTRIEHVQRLRREMPSKADVELFDVLTGDLP